MSAVLHIHRASRADVLVEALGGIMVEPLDDPMTAEIVSVPTRGIERWLTQRLSGRLGVNPGRSDGVCANVEFPFPARLVGAAVAAATGLDPDTDPWLPERSVWHLLDVVDECLGEPWLAALTAHLGGVGSHQDEDQYRQTRRFATVRHIAELYDRYGVHRPEMIRAWATAPDAPDANDLKANDLNANDLDHWQAELWRRLRRRIGQPSPAERLADACAHLVADPAVVDLPRRISLFGLTRLPASYLDVLRALALDRDVHLFLLHPSPALWARVADETNGKAPVVRRADDKTAEWASNLLLASWGQDAREMQLVLANKGPAVDDNRPVDQQVSSLLGRIQADVRADRAPSGDADGYRLDPSDHSVQVHSCHGRARQVEVIRDAILHLLATDSSLEPRDIIVMCPDIETFAPLIQATFGAGDSGDGGAGGDRDHEHTDDAAPNLRVRLADRSLRQTNPVLGMVSGLLDLAAARLTASQLLDFAGREPVRRRFQLDDDDLARVEEWVADTGIRWGFDAVHRAAFMLGQLEVNTWKAGLDRVLLGVTMADEGQRLLGGVLPLDDVDSGDIDLAGRLAELVDRLQAALDLLAQPKPVAEWAEAIAAAADWLTDTSEGDTWQRAELQRLLDDAVAQATLDATVRTALLTLPEIQSLLADRLQGRPTVANFRTGHLTICTLMPMRSVPHRVVCLLGLDDGVFPRKMTRDGDDLILSDPHVGDRDARSEDRQLLLDALLAATDHLIITYSGHDERTNASLPPAVPVGELLDVIDRTVTSEQPAGELIVVRHPLHPFDVRNFTVGALVPDRPWSFDSVALEGARALMADRVAAPLFLESALPDARTDPIELDQLVRFVQHPVRAFLRQRLGITVGDRSDDASDGLPIELDGLGQWSVGQRLLEARLGGADMATSVAAEIARGILPPKALAKPVLERVRPRVDDIVKEAEALAGDSGPASVDVNLRFPGGRALVGTVADVSGDVLRTVTYSRIAPKHRLAAWVRFLALTAAYPDRRFEAATVGRGFGETVAIARIPPQSARFAMGVLEVIAELYDEGMREPLPLYCATSAAYAEAAAAGRGAVQAARNEWESTWEWAREDQEPEHTLVLGGVRPFDDVLGENGAANAASSRFGRCALRLWDGLLSCEELVNK